MPQVQRILGSGVRAAKSEQEDELIHFCEKSMRGAKGLSGNNRCALAQHP